MSTPEPKRVGKYKEAREQIDRLIDTWRSSLDRMSYNASAKAVCKDIVDDLRVLKDRFQDPMDELRTEVRDASTRLAARINDLGALRQPILKDLGFILNTLVRVERVLEDGEGS